MADTIWTFSQSYSDQFQISYSDIDARIKFANTNSPSQEFLQGISVDLAKLSKTLVDATGSLPSYDQRQYEKQLKELETTLHELKLASQPKAKFSFKRKPAVAPVSNASSPVVTSSTEKVALAPILSETRPPISTTNLVLSNISYQYLTAGSLSGSLQQSDLTISDLDHCIVNLLTPSLGSVVSDEPRPPEITALHVRNLTNTILLLPAVKGSALIHDLSQCVLVLGCHQFRMHSSNLVDIYLSISSNPIIEHCKNIRFSQYPAALLRDNSNDTSIFQVQDFSHIRSTPSPNWVMKVPTTPESNHWPVETIHDRQMLEQKLEEALTCHD